MVDDKLLIELLRRFISGEDRSLKNAGVIEVELDSRFPDDDQIQEYVTWFACYRPGGGEFLYNETEMAKACEDIVNVLRTKYSLY